MKVEGRKERMVDKPTTDDSDVSEEDSEETDSEDVNKNGDQETDTSSDEGDEGDEGEDGDETETTDKGTKLDPDPKSAVHQQLANANRRIQQMEQVLGSPELLRKYAKNSGMSLTEAKAEIEGKKEEVEEFTPDKLKTAEDVAKALNTQAKEVKALREENKALKDNYQGISSSQRAQQVSNTMRNDVTTVREKYPELDPKNKEFDKDLEGEIGKLFHDLDFDPQTRTYRGNVSLAKLTDRVMKAAGKARKQGSKQAQTDIKVKKAGKVVTTGKGKTGDGESDDPGTAIAQRISKAIKGG